jgi:hypothetical protein
VVTLGVPDQKTLYPEALHLLVKILEELGDTSIVIENNEKFLAP